MNLQNRNRTSLAVQWLRFHAATAGGKVQSLVRELRFYVPYGTAKKMKRKVCEAHPRKEMEWLLVREFMMDLGTVTEI